MATQNISLNKFKCIANKALRMEREESQLNKASKSRHYTDPQVEPISIQVPQIKRSPIRPSSQPPSTRKDTSTTDSVKMLDNTLLSCNRDDNMDENVVFGRRQASLARTLHSKDDHVHLQRTLDGRVHPHRTLDDHIFSRHPKHDVYQCRSNDDELLHHHQVKKAHEHSQHSVRVARAAAAAAASTVVAQMRKDAVAAVARQHAPNNRMATASSASSAASSAAQSDKRRVIRNSNLLSSALSIIREMDPAFLEMLCYAIHDQVTTDDPSESD